MLAMPLQKGRSVGMGTMTEGSNLHGHAIPQGYVKVIIDYIQPITAPVFASSFDNSWTIHSMASKLLE